MMTALSWMLILMIGGLKCAFANGDSNQRASQLNPQDTEDLFLTSVVKKSGVEMARNMSRVRLFKTLFDIDAFSGFITINEATNSNLFFLLVVAENDTAEKPLLLWTQGGPGLSALFGEFLQNGPVAFNITENESGYPFTRRNNTLQKNMSVIYLDLPVGAGFSFTDTNYSYAKNLKEISDSVMVFLHQFLSIFDQYVCRDLYVAGESYGARYSVAIADALLTTKNTLFKFKGLIGGNGFLGPILDTADSSDFLYWTSMLDDEGYEQFKKRFNEMRYLKEIGNASMVPYVLLTTIFAYPNGTPLTLFQNLTSYEDHASPLYTSRPHNMLACFQFLSSNLTTREIFHVGQNRTFQYDNKYLWQSLIEDYMRDISNLTERVLNESSVLLYTGQLDALFPSVKQRAYYATLNWTHSEQYRNASRKLWRPPTWNDYMGYAGFVKRVHHFTEAVLLGMSHYGAAEKPDEVYYLMIEFINDTAHNVSFSPGGERLE